MKGKESRHIVKATTEPEIVFYLDEDYNTHKIFPTQTLRGRMGFERRHTAFKCVSRQDGFSGAAETRPQTKRNFCERKKMRSSVNEISYTVLLKKMIAFGA